MRMCTLHVVEDAYKPRSSPRFLKRLKFKEYFFVLKNNALPTLNKVFEKLSAELASS